MLPKKNRLIQKKDFTAVYQKGRVCSSEKRNIAIRCAKNTLKETRMGFIIGKKHSKKATERNKLKRLLRAAFYENIKLIKPGYDLIVSYSKNGQKTKYPDYKELVKQAKEVIKKIK